MNGYWMDIEIFNIVYIHVYYEIDENRIFIQMFCKKIMAKNDPPAPPKNLFSVVSKIRLFCLQKLTNFGQHANHFLRKIS